MSMDIIGRIGIFSDSNNLIFVIGRWSLVSNGFAVMISLDNIITFTRRLYGNVNPNVLEAVYDRWW